MVMAESKQKKLTKYFFNKVSKEWWVRTYDPSGNFLKFPSNKVRMETALKEIADLKIKGRLLDIGCGTGQLTIELLRRHNQVLGIDIAEKMVENSKDNLAKEKLKYDPDSVFKTMDLADLPRRERQASFDAAAALGLLEYLETDAELFLVLGKVLKKGGYALVECRNKFFNLFSVNKYTSRLAQSGELPDLIEKFSEAGKYSPLTYAKLPAIQKEVSKNVADFLSANLKNKKWFETRPPAFSNYPQKMVRRQHIPQELEASAKKFGFELDHIVYWHAHLYPPSLENNFPAFYNKISFLMAPLGYTPLGAWMCSSFIAVLRKKA